MMVQRKKACQTNIFIEGKIVENNSEEIELTLNLELADLQNNDINLQCLFENYVYKMINLTMLILDFELKNINSENINILVN